MPKLESDMREAPKIEYSSWYIPTIMFEQDLDAAQGRLRRTCNLLIRPFFYLLTDLPHHDSR
jgi:hypothetical protein